LSHPVTFTLLVAELAGPDFRAISPEMGWRHLNRGETACRAPIVRADQLTQ
jgi:hypothetical protein